jgi:hypothetical protein
MNITIEELTALIGAKQTAPAKQNLGQNIVVLDRGFVYVGDVEIDGDFAVITNAKNIRYWGTKKGLGELTNGPLAETKMDAIGTVKAPMRAVIHFVPCKGF